MSEVVQTISPDALTSPSANDSESSYQVVVKPEQNFVGTAKRRCNLKSGMNGSAAIVTQETVLSFLRRKARLKVGIRSIFDSCNLRSSESWVRLRIIYGNDDIFSISFGNNNGVNPEIFLQFL